MERADDVAAWASLTLQDEEGDDLQLGELWKDRAAVLAFVRHFG